MKKHITQPSIINHSFTLTTLALILTCVFAFTFLHSEYADASSITAKSNDREKQSIQKRTTKRIKKNQWIKGRLLITPRAGLTAKEMQKALGPYGIQPRDYLEALDVHICDTPEGADEEKIMHSLKQDDRFKAIELDMVVEPDLNITDPAFNDSWALKKIKAPTAWNTATGDGVTIAILDTGVNSSHPDLAANMVPGWNTYDDNNDSADIHGHGTKVAGAAAAAANNDAGSAGVAWNARIMPIRVTDLKGLGYYSSIAEGIRWAADNGAQVANISFRDLAKSATVKAAADYMRSKGGVVVVSAGNTGALHEYAKTDSLLVVSATDNNDTRPGWSSYGPYVDIAAPGTGIYTTTRNGEYGFVSGTSFSSPITAATVALMLSANNDLTPADLDQIIKSTAVDLGATGFDQYYGAGRINAAAAITEASARIIVDEQSPSISITAPSANSSVSGVIPVNVNYADNVGVTRVELYVNSQRITTDNLAPFAFVWDTTTLPDGRHTLTTRAYDAAGNMSTSPAISVIVSNSAPSEQPTSGIIVDNQSPNTSQTGIWKNSSGISPYNNNSVYSDSNGTFRWKPSMGRSGTYEAHAWWTYHKNRSSNVPYRIKHADGMTKINVDQHNQSLGGKWVLLGKFKFNANGTEYIEVSSENGQASADAVLFTPTEITIDNLDSSTSRTGKWLVSSGVSPYKTGSLYSDASSTFTWKIPSIVQNEKHEVFVWWTYHKNRSTNVPYRVHHKNGINKIVVNQRDQSQSSRWISLGTYTLKGDGTDKVVVSSENGQACADAVRLVRR